jgi:hypothetical protein
MTESGFWPTRPLSPAVCLVGSKGQKAFNAKIASGRTIRPLPSWCAHKAFIYNLDTPKQSNT